MELCYWPVLLYFQGLSQRNSFASLNDVWVLINYCKQMTVDLMETFHWQNVEPTQTKEFSYLELTVENVIWSMLHWLSLLVLIAMQICLMVPCSLKHDPGWGWVIYLLSATEMMIQLSRCLTHEIEAPGFECQTSKGRSTAVFNMPHIHWLNEELM